MKYTGAQILLECLIKEGVNTIFGYPGGANLPIYDALGQYPQIHHVLGRHEQGLTHMADGFARAGGGVGVAMATSGPGATNMVTGIATAMMNSPPSCASRGRLPATLSVTMLSRKPISPKSLCRSPSTITSLQMCTISLQLSARLSISLVLDARGLCWLILPKMHSKLP